MEAPGNCPLCSGPLTLRTGPFSDFWGCAKFPECKGKLKAEYKAVPTQEEEVSSAEHLRLANEFARAVNGFDQALKWLRLAQSIAELTTAKKP